ncbi:translation initiation factor IF-2-like [Grus americana]|uniref:translation initiation factor IF-2-like n=1 Tax=Grus americana TaxID=9117 RepID=UPI0024083949|nr:translation initiation factor IF-2-like [Grus americana]
MRSRPALAALLVLALPLALARPPAAAAPPGPAPPAQGMPVPEPLPWRDRGIPGAAYAALLQLLREEDAGPPAAPQKRKSRPVPVPAPQPGPAALTAGLSAGDMHDFFVGLMGKRAAEPGRPAGQGSGGPSPRCSPGPSAAGGAPLRAA